MADMIKGPVGIKKLLLVLELAKQSGSVSLGSFRQACMIRYVRKRHRFLIQQNVPRQSIRMREKARRCCVERSAHVV